MQQYQDYAGTAAPQAVATAPPAVRAEFMRKVYLHIAGALVLFMVLEAFLQSLPFAERMVNTMNNVWLLVIIGMTAVGWIASKWTMPGLPLSQQYLGLVLYTIGQAIIFMPLIAYIRFYEDDNILVTGGLITLGLVAGLSLIGIDGRTSFSWMRAIIMIAFPVSFGLVIASILFGFGLGTWFSLAMIVLASGSILYQTDQIFKRSRTDAYVSAALGLFSSIMLLLWYVLRLMAARR